MAEKRVEPTYRPEWQERLIMTAVIVVVLGIGVGLLGLVIRFLDYIPASLS
ncbi:MAG: hypothetical protein UU76_C0007G0033 [Parcubacteria group bacterium GW2011_GWC1_41_7]|nr:MAG: hypothetical protein UU76_C0007G0033 [Parcubacteria group bacterium GW2011_GWC1_41_7]